MKQIVLIPQLYCCIFSHQTEVTSCLKKKTFPLQQWKKRKERKKDVCLFWGHQQSAAYSLNLWLDFYLWWFVKVHRPAALSNRKAEKNVLCCISGTQWKSQANESKSTFYITHYTENRFLPVHKMFNILSNLFNFSAYITSNMWNIMTFWLQQFWMQKLPSH